MDFVTQDRKMNFPQDTLIPFRSSLREDSGFPSSSSKLRTKCSAMLSGIGPREAKNPGCVTSHCARSFGTISAIRLSACFRRAKWDGAVLYLVSDVLITQVHCPRGVIKIQSYFKGNGWGEGGGNQAPFKNMDFFFLTAQHPESQH